jgi:hypothetical protein
LIDQSKPLHITISLSPAKPLFSHVHPQGGAAYFLSIFSDPPLKKTPLALQRKRESERERESMRAAAMCALLFAAMAQAQVCNPAAELQQPFTVRSAADAAELSSAIACPDQNLSVEWAGDIELSSTIVIGNGSSLSIAASDAAAAANLISSGQAPRLLDVYGSLELVSVTLVGQLADAAAADSAALAGGVQGRAGSTITVIGCQFFNHSAAQGAAIASDGAVDIRDSVFANNVALEQGGALRLSATGTATISNTTFVDNEVTRSKSTGDDSFGGSLYLEGNSSITGCLFDSNRADAGNRFVAVRGTC